MLERAERSCAWARRGLGHGPAKPRDDQGRRRGGPFARVAEGGGGGRPLLPSVALQFKYTRWDPRSHQYDMVALQLLSFQKRAWCPSRNGPGQ